MKPKKMGLGDFEIEYGTDEETTDNSPLGFTDKFGDEWRCWNIDDEGVMFRACRQRDDFIVDVIEP